MATNPPEALRPQSALGADEVLLFAPAFRYGVGMEVTAQKEWLSLSEAAEMLGVTTRTIHTYVKKKGWATRLETVQGDRFRTQRPMLALGDVLAV